MIALLYIIISYISTSFFRLERSLKYLIKYLLSIIVIIIIGNESQRDQLAKDPRVKAVEPNKVSMQRFRTARDLPRHSLPPVPSPVAELSNAKAKREVSYATQSNAASELVVVSQPR